MTRTVTAPLRIGVFYDGNFLLHTSNYYNHIHSVHSRLSIAGLHEFIRHEAAASEGIAPRYCHITEAHYFRGRINAMEASQRGSQLYNDRVFEDILMAEGIQTHFLPLRNLSGKKEERGIDVWLSLEAAEMALLGKIDVAVLIISDTDYVPLLRKLSACGTRVMLLSWEFEYQNDDGARIVTKTSHELLGLASHPLAMHKIIDEGLEAGDPLIGNLFVGSETPYARPAEDVRIVSEVLSLKAGYGFIKYQNNNLYFSFQDFTGEAGELEAGDRVEFNIVRNPAKNQDVARNVVKIQPTTQP